MSVALEFRNLDAFAQQMKNWVEAVRDETAAAVVGLAQLALQEVAEDSPQYSGDFAANWKLSVGAPNFTFQSSLFPLLGGPRIGGDREAVDYALAANAGALAGFQLGDSVYLANAAEHDEAYAWKIEYNKIKFREGNHGAPLRNWAALASVKYANWTPAVVEQLVRAGGMR